MCHLYLKKSTKEANVTFTLTSLAMPCYLHLKKSTKEGQVTFTSWTIQNYFKSSTFLPLQESSLTCNLIANAVKEQVFWIPYFSNESPQIVSTWEFPSECDELNAKLVSRLVQAEILQVNWARLLAAVCSTAHSALYYFLCTIAQNAKSKRRCEIWQGQEKCHQSKSKSVH